MVDYPKITDIDTEQAYHDAAMRTAAGPEVFHADNYGCRDLVLALAKYIVAARHLDAAKSALFYGKHKEVVTEDVSPIIASGGTEGTYDFDFITNPQLIHAILGIASEGGEIAEDLLAGLSGELASYDNVNRESGDIDWFQELLATVTGQSVTDNRVENIDRLVTRYPEAFSGADGIARADEAGDTLRGTSPGRGDLSGVTLAGPGSTGPILGRGQERRVDEPKSETVSSGGGHTV